MARIALLALAILAASAAQAQNPSQPGFFVDAQFLWFDSPIAVGPFNWERPPARDDPGLVLFAPRLIAGYDDGLGARVRWWSFDRATTLTGPFISDRDMRLQFDVVDLEATMHVRDTGWDFLVAAGARLAAIEADEAIVNGAPFHEQGDFGGVTLASEGRRSLIAGNNWSANAVCGGRLSMLKGAWSGPLVPYNATDYYRDYNERYLVPEVFAGLEASYGHAFSRVTVEIQDWRGGTLGAPRHDYAFTGFGFDVGWTF